MYATAVYDASLYRQPGVGDRPKRQTMRFLIVAVTSVSALAFASGAFGETAQKSPPPPTTGTGTDATRQEHPVWFTEPNTYKPCPSSVVLANGQHVCLGCPTACRSHF